MAYATDNPPRLLVPSLDGSTPAVWHYLSANSFSQVAAADFFSDATNLGLKVGDGIVVVESDNAYSTALFSVSAITDGAATVTRGQQLTGTTAPGPGIDGAVGGFIATSVTPFGAAIKTDIFIDLTGLNEGGTAGDIIGINGTGAAYLGRIVAPRSGVIFGGRMTCLETPAGGGTDIDLYAADEATGVEDTAISVLTETQLINAGASSNGSTDPMTALPTIGQYLYLVGQGTSDATYTAGVLHIELWGLPA